MPTTRPRTRARGAGPRRVRRGAPTAGWGPRARRNARAAAAAGRVAVAIGAVTLPIGAVLLAAPRRVGDLLGIDDDDGVRAVGAADLALVPGLLLGRPRWPWVVARAALNLVIAGWLVDRAGGADTRRPLPFAAALGLATVGDLRTALVLRRAQA